MPTNRVLIAGGGIGGLAMALTLEQIGVPFREIRIPLRQPDTRARMLEHSPAGRVPILKDGDITVWESLAILDYLAEKFPAAGLWPEGAAARAEARSIAAEMHGGFTPLRQQLPMDIRARKPLKADAAAEADMRRRQFGEQHAHRFDRRADRVDGRVAEP